MNGSATSKINERPISAQSGWAMLPLMLIGLGVGIFLLIRGIAHQAWPPGIVGGTLALFCLIGFFGLFIVNPNESRVIIFFGVYRGTVRKIGFHWVNPFSVKRRISLRVRTFETGSSSTPDVKDPTTGKVIAAGTRSRGMIKVNDRDGNPIEIAAVVVWQVTDTAKALFSVDSYQSFVEIQSESALRNLASQYHYDSPDEDAVSLRGNTDLIGERLRDELHQRLAQAGVEVLEARISSLAYAPEIAAAMLRRQQASAVIAARTKIVEGAVSMVEMALARIQERGVVELAPQQKAQIVGNLLVILCSDRDAQPVVPTS
jgi:regulator of protease activity HflC (stomatin/prohibitin superfamily)